MKKILLARIDDRLIHGQVIVSWIKSYRASTILIVDDELSKNAIMQRIYKASSPSDVELVIKGIEDATDYIKEDNGETLMILVKAPQLLEGLLNDGIIFERTVLGGMGANSKRKQFIKNVFASEDEVECLKRMINSGVAIDYQLVPDDKPYSLGKHFE